MFVECLAGGNSSLIRCSVRYEHHPLETERATRRRTEPMMGMSNEEVINFNRGVIDQFRAGAGELTDGPLAGNPTLLVTMVGAKTGRELTSPLTYVRDGEDYVVMASAGGSEKPPNWLFNCAQIPTLFSRSAMVGSRR